MGIVYAHVTHVTFIIPGYFLYDTISLSYHDMVVVLTSGPSNLSMS